MSVAYLTQGTAAKILPITKEKGRQPSQCSLVLFSFNLICSLIFAHQWDFLLFIYCLFLNHPGYTEYFLMSRLLFLMEQSTKWYRFHQH